MTILIVLLGLLLSHLVFPLTRLRQFGWFARLMGRVRRSAWGRAGPVLALTVLVTALALALLLDALATLLQGDAGRILLSLAVIVYCQGPRDLDCDVQVLMAGGNHSAYLQTRRIMRIGRDAAGAEGAAAILHAAQARWFGVLFWFVLLGIPGALLYRLSRISLNLSSLSPSQSAWLLRLRDVLDWPVLVLILLSAALGGDYDRVRDAWRSHQHGRPMRLLQAGVLDEVGKVVVERQAGFEEGVTVGHHLVWRMLMIWLVVLSLLLLTGWLA